MVVARSNFFIWFFGASGAAGIARSSFPRMFDNVMEIRRLKDAETKGGETVGLNPICGYPRDLAKADLDLILKNSLNVDQIVAKYPIVNNTWSQKGYLTYEAFKKANTKADPLAVRAVFDCFAQSTELSDPRIAQAKLDKYKADINNFTSDLLFSKLVGWAAIITLLGLLGLADIEAYGFAYEGWFPDWPGGRLWLEGGLFDPQTGPWTIPKYWI